MEISEELAFNIVQDWKKKDISLEEKSKFLKSLLKELKVSQRELARVLEVPHSTLQDWISLRQIEKVKWRKENELEFLLDRLIFVLSKPYKISEETFKKIKRIKSEFEKLELEVV